MRYRVNYASPSSNLNKIRLSPYFLIFYLLQQISCQLYLMFLFSCCTQVQNNQVYQLRTKQNKQFNYSILDPLDSRTTKPFSQSTQVIKVKTSDYQELIKQYKNSPSLWQDFQFPHNSLSLGQMEGLDGVSWKRLSSIINNPILFDGRIQPQDVIQGSLGDCYFLSALSALAEQQQRIIAIFGEQEGTKYGIYKVTLRINGVIEQILVDDYVPVNSKGEPLFCQPNKQQIWVPILQKAWAKANGSYANIVAGSPVQIFRATTYAPAETLYAHQKQDEQLIWSAILQNAKLNRPCCCGTDDSVKIDWNSLNLVPGHAYTLIDAAQLETIYGTRARMLKLRNPWGNTEWKGQGCETDTTFWKSIVSNQTKSNFLKDFSINNDGIFFINFKDYSRYFSQTHICHMQEHGNYIYENFTPLAKSGSHWSLCIFQQGVYWIELHQRNGRKQSLDQSSLARSTLVVARVTQSNQYQFVNGVLSQYKEDCSLRVKLTPGKYIIFSKFDTNKEQILPLQASISIYSLYYTILESVNSAKFKQMLTQSFLDHAKKTKRQKYEKDTLWVSYKLFYKEGGYAYICFGVEKESKYQWQVNFNESQFTKEQFKLKKPFKGKGDNQVFKVRPGQQKIIVARVLNNNPTNLKFPPKLTYKIQPI